MKSAAEAIRARGYRKWYEARLIEAHLHLITAFLCLIAVLATVEMQGLFRTLAQTLWVLTVLAFLGGADVSGRCGRMELATLLPCSCGRRVHVRTL